MLRNLPQYIQDQTGKTVRLADAKAWISRSETQLSPANSCVIGLAILGNENCVKEKTTKVQPPVPEPQIFNEGEIEVVIKDPVVKPVKNPKDNIIVKGWKNFKDMFDDGADNLFEGKKSNSNE